MAYKTYIGSAFFSLDGVPFTVSEKWKPPKKVTLPLKFETGNPSEVLFLEYDSTLEETLLAQLEAEREIEKTAAAAAAAASAVASTAAAEASSDSNESSINSVVERYPQKNLPKASNHNGLESGNVGDQLGNRPAFNSASAMAGMLRTDSGRVLMPSNAAYHVMGSNILVPTPISVPVYAGKSNATNNFDLKDFENEQDPFENLSLKVINDIEELDKVFLATSESQSNLGKTLRQENNSTGGGNSGFNQVPGVATCSAVQEAESLALSNGGSSMHVQQHLVEKHGIADRQVVVSTSSVSRAYPLPSGTVRANYAGVSELMLSGNSGHKWLVPSSLRNSHPNPPGSGIPDVVFPPNPASSVLNPKGDLHAMGMHKVKPETGIGGTQLQPSSNDINFMGSYVQGHNSILQSTKQTDFSKGHVPYNQLPAFPSWANSAAGAGWPYPANTYSLGVSDGNEALMSHNHFGANSGSVAMLRSAKSNPDLTATHDGTAGSAVGAFGRHTPPIFGARSHFHERTRPDLVPFQVPVRGATSQPLDFSQSEKEGGSLRQSAKESSVEDKLFSCLSEEAKTFVNFITAMGFPKLETIRAVQRLGLDEKLVLDHLCAFSKLKEKRYSPADIEKALLVFEGDVEKAESYINSTMTFRAMGFDEQKISTALVECSLDEEKSLDWLTS